MYEEKMSDNSSEFSETLLSLLKKNMASTTKPTNVYMLQIPIKTESCWTSNLKLIKEQKQNINKFRSLADFTEHVSLSLKPKITARKRKHSNPSDVISDNKRKKENYLGTLYNEVIIEAALKKCLVDKTFWSETGLVTLIEKCLITPRLRDTMLELIMKYQFIEVFQVITKCKLVLTSTQIVSVLKFLLSGYIKQDLNHQSKIVQEELSSVLHLDFDEVTMRSHLKSLSTNEASVFLNFLVAVLKACSPAIETSDLNLHAHSEVTVLKWIDSLLSAHLLSFTVSASFVPMVEELRQLLMIQGRFHHDISLLRPYFVYRDDKIILTSKRKNKLYSFENIIL